MKTKLQTIRIATLVLALLPILCAASAMAAADTCQPTADEQVLLERINAARVNQAGESTRLNLDFQAGMSYKVQANLQPLIWRSGMGQAAQQHDQDMWDRGYYAHVTPEGVTPFQQVQPFDTDFIAVGQNLGAGRMYITPDSVYAGWMVDQGIVNCGHRQNILNAQIDSFGADRASRDNTYYGTYWTAYFGVSQSQHHYVTGVIYRDLNRNGRYDAGEGQAHWKVRLIAQSPDASAAATEEPAFVNAYDTGGYAVAAPAEGDYTIEAVSPTGETLYSSTGIDSANVKVDFALTASQASSAQNAPAASGSGKKSGCEIGTTTSGTTWAFLAAMGVMLAAILGLRIRA